MRFAIQKARRAWCLSTGHVHTVVAATVERDSSAVTSMSAGAARRLDIASPAIDDVLRLAANGEKANTPHQSTAMIYRKRFREESSEELIG